MNRKGRMILGIGLIAVGVALCFLPTCKAKWEERAQEQLLMAWEQSLTVLADEVPPEAVAPDVPIETAEDTEADAALLQAQREEAQRRAKEQAEKQQAYIAQHMIGTLTIEDIALYQPILDETTAENLQISLTMVQPSALPGQQGNLVIAGHNNYGDGRHFNRLADVVIGAAITAATKEGEYTYIVSEITIVEPDDTAVLLGERGQSTITLITCYPQKNPDKRLIVKGVLQESTPKAETNTAEGQA